MLTLNAVEDLLQQLLLQELAMRQDIERQQQRLWGIRGQIDLLNQIKHRAEAQHQQAARGAQAPGEQATT